MSKLSDRPKTLKVSDFKHYLNDEIQLGYYQEINVAGSTEKEKFRVDVEARVAERMNQKKADFAILHVRLGVPKRVILFGYKRSEFASRGAEWAAALQQAVDYCKLVRDTESDPDKTLYITVNIGTYLRFYELPPLSSAVKDWAPGGGVVYELADDESKVWELWLLLRDQVMQ